MQHYFSPYVHCWKPATCFLHSLHVTHTHSLTSLFSCHFTHGSVSVFIRWWCVDDKLSWLHGWASPWRPPQCVIQLMPRVQKIQLQKCLPVHGCGPLSYPISCTYIPTCTLTPSHISTSSNKQVVSSLDALDLVWPENTHEELRFLQSFTHSTCTPCTMLVKLYNPRQEKIQGEEEGGPKSAKDHGVPK